MKYRESEEMYLETILILKKKDTNIRSIDVANDLNYSRASVSRAINLLRQKEYITINSGIINFTELGLARAKEILERHHIITEVLIKMGIEEGLAEDNACRIEHVISNEVLDAFKNYLEK